MKYLYGTKNLCPTFRTDDIGVTKLHIDASYAFHGDCRGHTLTIITLGGGAVTSFSRKQKLTVKSSTES